MKTFNDIPDEDIINFNYMKKLYDSFLENVEKMLLETGYINLDMKEPNLVIDESKGKENPNVLFIDTDPTFFIKLVDDDKLNTLKDDTDLIKGIKFAMLILILFPFADHNKLNIMGYVYDDDKKFVNYSKKRVYLQLFMQENEIYSYNEMLRLLEYSNNKINEILYKNESNTIPMDLEYMMFYYIVKTYHPIGNNNHTQFYKDIDYFFSFLVLAKL